MSQPSPIQIDHYLPHMRDVVYCQQSLHELNLMWRIIESSAKMNCPLEAKSILPTMAATRSGFNRLEKELVLSLVQEKVATVLDEIGTKAQYAIDILVRNLYERTADVGFLATDKELCAFVAGISGNQELARIRLRAYQKKYTVYDEIILIDTVGNVLVQINQETPIEGSTDPLIKETIAKDHYVETYRASDLRPSREKSLIYSKRMLHPESGAVVGVLCLCFNFEEEMASIFKSHGDATGSSVMLLLDADNRVIETSDRLWVPVNALVPTNHQAESSLSMFAGREYLVRTLSSEGYQGYMGPKGWQGQVMIPVATAFSSKETSSLKALKPEIAEGLLSHAQSFCPPLFEVINAASSIRRVVWNGQVMTAGQSGELLRLKTILDQISENGARSNELFTQSINDLYETVLSSRKQNSEFVSHLLVDLLDRNLYERADDCRWWAVTPELRAALATKPIDAKTNLRITEILTYINSLYTVYTRIFVYDEQGLIVASTNQQGAESVVGQKIDALTLNKVISLKNEQQYYVSPFVADPLYNNQPTYIYHAAIMAPESNKIVGGIGIVFDSAVEFCNMLKGCLAQKESIKAYFINRQGLIISSTDANRPVGTTLAVDADLLNLKSGKSASRVVIQDDEYAVLGCSASEGYREFKVLDGYKEDVIAVVYNFLGQVKGLTSHGATATTLVNSDYIQSADPEYATFYIGAGLYAIEAEYVMEAFPVSEVSPVSLGGRTERVGVLTIKNETFGKSYAWVYDLGLLLSGVPSKVDSNSQVIMVEFEQHKVGLLVSALHSVAQFSHIEINATPLSKVSDGALIKQIIKANQGELLIQGLDIRCLFKLLNTAPLPATNMLV
jgi:chemotaxis signal transduction protein